MKLFRNVRTYFDTMGIYCHQTNQARSLNVRILLLLSPIIVMFITTLAFLVFRATAAFEYAICFHFNITRANALVTCLIMHFQMPKITKFIEKCERFIERSECIGVNSFDRQKLFIWCVYFHSITGMWHDSTSSISTYIEVAAKIEHFSELTHFIVMKVLYFAIVVPPIAGTFIKYYILGLGDASYQDLPFMYGTDSVV